MKNKKNVVLVIALALVGIVAFYLYEDDIAHNGRAYTTKATLCMQFAQSYLRTIPKTEPNFNDKKWSMAIDVETELYDLCLLDLNKEAIGNYKPTSLEKYQK